MLPLGGGTAGTHVRTPTFAQPVDQMQNICSTASLPVAMVWCIIYFKNKCALVPPLGVKDNGLHMKWTRCRLAETGNEAIGESRKISQR